MITSTEAGRDGVTRIKGWLESHGIKTARATDAAPFDLWTMRGARIECKSAPFTERLGKKEKYSTHGWFFNIHRHGVLKEENVDFYVLRCEPNTALRAIGFTAPIYLVCRAPIGTPTLALTVRTIIRKWGRYVDALEPLQTFDSKVVPGHLSRTILLSGRRLPPTPSEEQIAKLERRKKRNAALAKWRAKRKKKLAVAALQQGTSPATT